VFLGQVCPGLQSDTVDEWTARYERAGLTDLRGGTGPFEMMIPRGFLADEGAHALQVCAAALTRARLRKMAWLMSRMMRAVPYLGYVVIAGTKPASQERPGGPLMLSAPQAVRLAPFGTRDGFQPGTCQDVLRGGQGIGADPPAV
jgi:hypothetical protein